MEMGNQRNKCANSDWLDSAAMPQSLDRLSSRRQPQKGSPRQASDFKRQCAHSPVAACGLQHCGKIEVEAR